MKISKEFRRFIATLILGIFTVSTINPVPALAGNGSDEIVYPLKEISKLECRFKEFSDLSSNCKQDLPILKPKDYVKYSKQSGGYNDYTRLYTVLWGSSYKYGWDVGNGGHMWVDIATAKWTPVYSMAEWKVTIAKDLGMLGLSVTVEHIIDGKKVVSNYSHLSKISVSKWEKVNAGEKVGEVWSTGNSTGNHLHFQIDLDTAFHPAYYNYKTCPYSYNQISENGVCFSELQQLTVDPLDFIQSGGGILANISVQKTTTGTQTVVKNNYTWVDLGVFSRTVYRDYAINDIKSVQQIYKDLWYYNWAINWEYRDVEDDIIRYQIDTKVIANKYENGAGYFGPKTRAQTKKDYTKFLENGGKTVATETNNTQSVVTNTNKVQKISKKDLLTREEIEAREVEDFLRRYNVELNFKKAWNNVKVGSTKILKLKITDTRGKPFKGNMPSGMTFVIDNTKATVFPTKLYYFTDGKRDIKVTGKKTGNTKLFIKIGDKVIKTIDMKVYTSNEVVYPESTLMVANSKAVIGDKQTGVVVFKDSGKNNLINIPFGSTFTLKANGANTVCIKKGDIKDIQKIYKSNCAEQDYKYSQSFDYSDTVWGILIYDYKVREKGLIVSVTNNYNKAELGTKSVYVKNPKGLNNTYAYKNEVVDLLSKGIVDGIDKGYFLEDRAVKKRDALSWIENGLRNLNNQTLTSNARATLNSNLSKIETEINNTGKFTTLTREELLKISYDYLVLNKSHSTQTRNYLDLDDAEDEEAAAIFSGSTWKDKFWEKYFRPDEKVTRWETTYFISKAMDQSYQRNVVYK